MSNINIFIAVAVAVVVTFGFFWFFGGNFALAPTLPIGEVEERIVEEAPALQAVRVALSKELGRYLTDVSGMTLYTTTRQSCIGDCLVIWPAYMAEGAVRVEDTLGTLFRGDIGKYQYTWDRAPLYYYNGDTLPGDVGGHEVGGVWFVARP